MKKLLSAKDMLILGLAGVLDVFQEMKDPFDTISDGHKLFYGYVPRRFKKTNFRHLVWRSLKTGEIEKVVKQGKVYFRLTSVGRKKVSRDFPLFSLQKKKWDGKWRIAAFDVAERKRRRRDYLRNKLVDLGFGMLQQSVWLTPYDILADFREFIEAKRLTEQVYLMEVSHLVAGDSKALAEKVWKIDKINEAYQMLHDQIKEIEGEVNDLKMTHGRGVKLNALEKKELKEGLKQKVRRIKQQYLNIVLKDPHLPRELLPGDWEGEVAAKKIRELSFLS